MDTRINIWRVIIFTLLLEAIMIGLAFGWVAVYSNLIYTRGDLVYYQQYARSASPIVSMVAGPLVFGAAGLMLRKRLGNHGKREMWWTLGLYLILDIIIVVVAAQELTRNLLLWVPNAVTKAIGVWIGMRIGRNLSNG